MVEARRGEAFEDYGQAGLELLETVSNAPATHITKEEAQLFTYNHGPLQVLSVCSLHSTLD
jgi:hypothetical protein